MITAYPTAMCVRNRRKNRNNWKNHEERLKTFANSHLDLERLREINEPEFVLKPIFIYQAFKKAPSILPNYQTIENVLLVTKIMEMWFKKVDENPN